jgi:hypothetical protein
MKCLTRIFTSLYVIVLLMNNSSVIFGQNLTESSVEQAVGLFFNAMKLGNVKELDNLMAEECLLTTVNDQNSRNEIMDKTQFIDAIKKIINNNKANEEKIYNLNTRIDQNLAVVSAEYSFFINDELSHCGLDVFTLACKKNSWKIISIVDTRRKAPCAQNPEKEVNDLMDNWHKAAGTANANIFFGSMAKDGIYIGTDATERWTRDEMKEWSSKYFERESAWDFKPIERKVYFTSDRKTAWFNETLNTWMGICRGSGILTNDSTGWKIQQYHLSVTVPNESIEGFVKLVGAPGRKK